MKKILSLAALLILAGTLCASAETTYGIIYKDATEPGNGYTLASCNKVGQAVCTSYFGLVAVGDCSVTAAAKKGGIKNLSYYDQHTKNILGFKKVTIKAYGN